MCNQKHRLEVAVHLSKTHRSAFQSRANHEWYVVFAIYGLYIGFRSVSALLCVIPLAIYLLSIHSRNRYNLFCAELSERYLYRPSESGWQHLHQRCCKRPKLSLCKSVYRNFFYQWTKWLLVYLIQIIIMVIPVIIIA